MFVVLVTSCFFIGVDKVTALAIIFTARAIIFAAMASIFAAMASIFAASAAKPAKQEVMEAKYFIDSCLNFDYSY